MIEIAAEMLQFGSESRFSIDAAQINGDLLDSQDILERKCLCVSAGMRSPSSGNLVIHFTLLYSGSSKTPII